MKIDEYKNSGRRHSYCQCCTVNNRLTKYYIKLITVNIFHKFKIKYCTRLKDRLIIMCNIGLDVDYTQLIKYAVCKKNNVNYFLQKL